MVGGTWSRCRPRRGEGVPVGDHRRDLATEPVPFIGEAGPNSATVYSPKAAPISTGSRTWRAASYAIFTGAARWARSVWA